MSKILKWALCPILMLALLLRLAPPALAADRPCISVCDAEAVAGERVEMEIYINGSPGISGASLSISYDREALSLAEIRPAAGGLFTGLPQSGSFSWLRGSDAEGDFSLALLVFDISASAEGEYEIGVALTGGISGNLTNQKAETVEADFVSGSLKVGGGCPSARFSDLNTAAWYHEAIDFVLNEGLMNGVGTATFAPNTAAGRAMVSTTLYRMAGSPAVEGDSPYIDAPGGSWYSDSLLWAWERGLAQGYGKGLFGPADSVTREQLAAMLHRYAGSPGSGQSLDGFSDSGEISPWAGEAMRWAVETGLIRGRGDGIIAPKSPATRAELAQMILNFSALE